MNDPRARSTIAALARQPALPRPLQLGWLAALRLFFAVMLFALTSSSYLHNGFHFTSYSGRVLAGGLVLACIIAVVHFACRDHANVRQIRCIELFVEQAVWTSLIYVTGGVTSGATALYGLTCLSGAILIGTKGPLIAASSAAMFYSLMCSALVGGVLEPPHDQSRSIYATEPRDVAYPFLINLVVLTVVAVLAEHLAKRLKLTGGHLAEATRRAEHAERLAALGRIAAGLAHEIRNPLGSILGSVQLIGSAPGVSDEARHLCGIVERETARLNDLVEDMLQLARPRPPMFVALDVAGAAREVAALAAESGRGSDVVVRYAGPSTEVVAIADAGQLRQVMWNLLRNAVQASSPGAAVTLRVGRERETTGEARTTRGYFEVEDEGPGIPPEAKERLFDAFFTTRSNGIGIGLAVVKRIVDEHGWHIDVHTASEVGAVFRVTYPVSNAPVAAPDRPSASRFEPSETGTPANARG